MVPPAAPPKPELVEATETEIKVRFQGQSGLQYTLQWKDYTQSWDNITSSVSVDIGAASASSSSKLTATAAPLQPGTTYCLRLMAMNHRDDDDANANAAAVAEGESTVGPELIVDTEQVGCTPSNKQGCCTIL